MKKRDIRVGAIYAAKVSGRVSPVQIVGQSPYGGWIGVNQWTGREVRIRTAGRLRYEVEKAPGGNTKYTPVYIKSQQ